MQKFILVAICLQLLTNSARSQSAAGFVFEDLNGNGKKDRKEKGLAGIGVSNGKDIVLTDIHGRYELPVGNDNIIFVIKPPSYAVPVNGRNQPTFFLYT